MESVSDHGHCMYVVEDAYSVWCACAYISLIARYMGPIWGRKDPGGPHVGPMNFAIWVVFSNDVYDRRTRVTEKYINSTIFPPHPPPHPN